MADVSPLGVAVASPLREATQAGHRAADAGGNALDAALATAAVLAVAYPHNCAIGGDLLALVRDPDGTITFVNGSGPAPAGVDVEALQAGHRQMPLYGPHAITVPGLVGGWAAIHAAGAARPWADALRPAAELAADGVGTAPGLAEALVEDQAAVLTDPGLAEVFAPGGKVLAAGQTLRQPALARTLHQLAEQGTATWYGGDLGRQLVGGLNARGVPLSIDDLAGFVATTEPALTVSAAGWHVTSAPPNSQGFLLLQLLGAFALAGQDGGSETVALMHQLPLSLIARAFMNTTEQRLSLLADPPAMTIDVRDLLTDAALASFLDAARRPSTPAPSHRRPDGDTVAVVAVDTQGRSVSLIQSVYHSLGSHILEPSTGVVMHNRGGCFSLDPQSPNVIAGGKRPAHTLTPVLAERPGQQAAVGTMGGEMQPQILTQVLSQLFSGASPQEAVAAPRWTVGPWDRDDPADQLTYEADIDDATLRQIKQWPGPHRQIPAHSSETGHSQVATVSQGHLEAGTDPRADGLARG